eukprot:Selendium_serpulae@DN6139_c3_g3_i1.p1
MMVDCSLSFVAVIKYQCVHKTCENHKSTLPHEQASFIHLFGHLWDSGQCIVSFALVLHPTHPHRQSQHSRPNSEICALTAVVTLRQCYVQLDPLKSAGFFQKLFLSEQQELVSLFRLSITISP